MKNVARNLNLNWDWDYGVNDSGSQYLFDKETFKKMLIIFGAGSILGVWLALVLAGFLYGIQQKTVEQGKLSYGKLFLIIIAPCILLGLIAGILLL
jgi:flagellar biosynthesis protein FliQ